MESRKYFKVTFQFDTEDNINLMTNYIEKKMKAVKAESLCSYEDLGIQEVDYLCLLNDTKPLVNDIIEEGYIKQVKLNCSVFERKYLLLFEFSHDTDKNKIFNIWKQIHTEYPNELINTNATIEPSNTFTLSFYDKTLSDTLISRINNISLEKTNTKPLSIFDWQDIFINQEYSLNDKKKIILK